jgi:hypothetical protein
MATFIETWMAGGIGRAQGAYDEMVFRSMVRDDARFYDPLGLVSEGTRIDFQVEVNSYLYGTRFISWLAYTHGPETVIDWVSRTEGSRKYYGSQFRQVYGRSIDEAWAEWVAWEHEFQRANLERIREYPTTSHEDLSERALGSVSRAHLDTDSGELYAAFNYPGVVAHLGAISLDDGSVRKIIDVKSPLIYSVTSLAFDPGSKTLFYTTDNREHRDLRAVDPQTGKARTLIREARIGDLVFDPSDRSLWGVRHFNGIATLVRIPHPWTEWKQVHSWPYGEILYDLAISPDGRLLAASVGEITGRQVLRVMETERLLAGDPEPLHEVDFASTVPEKFVFSPDGRYLYGSSYYTGVSNIFRYALESGETEAVSNCETGCFHPIPLGGDELLVLRYTGEGFVPSKIEGRPLEDVNPIVFLGERIADEHPVVREWNVGPPSEIELEPRILHEGDYRIFGGLALESLYPIVQGYKDTLAAGFRINFSDPMRLNRLYATGSISPFGDLDSSEQVHLELGYERYDWHFRYRHNNADFYDLFGPTKVSRRGYSLNLGWKKTLIYDLPRKLSLSIDAAYFGDMEELPFFQDIEATADDMLSGWFELNYENLRRSLGAVDDEKGLRWDVYGVVSHLDYDTIPQILTRLDLGIALPIRHSSLWLRSSAGVGDGELEDPFANFYFGGFRNNWVDYREIKRYREFYAFPGFEINELAGRNYVRTMLEWNLPPIRFRKVGTKGLFLSWIRPAIFASAIATNLDLEEETTAQNLGAQLDLRLTALSRLNMTVSLGYAVGFVDGGDSRDEIMVSLNILE